MPVSRTLKLWEACSLGVFRKILNEAINRFESANSDVHIEPSSNLCDLYNLQLTNATASGKLPDIFHTWGGKMLKSLIEKGEVYDLTQDLSSDRWRETFIPASLDCYKFNGGSYAVPVTFGAVSFYYNKEIFTNHNLSIPQDFDELIDLCRKLRRKGIIPISLGNKEGWEGDFFFTYLASRIGGDNLVNNILERAPGFYFTDSCLVKTGEKIQQLVDTKAFPENFNDLNYYQQRSLFWERKAAMQLNGNRLISKFLEVESPELIDKLDFFNFPLVSGGKGYLTSIQGGSQLSFAISSNCRNKKKAIEFLHEVTSPRTAEDIITKAQDIPARRGILTSKVFNPLLVKVVKELDKAKKVQIHFFRSLPPTLSRIYLKVLRSIFEKTITPEEGVNTVEEAAQDLDNKNNWL